MDRSVGNQICCAGLGNERATEAAVMSCRDNLRAIGGEPGKGPSEALPVIVVEQILWIIQNKDGQPSAGIHHMFAKGEIKAE